MQRLHGRVRGRRPGVPAVRRDRAHRARRRRAVISWEQLRDIVQAAAALAADERAQPPEACPNDGEPLRSGPDGQLYCPWDGWRPDGRYVGQ
ncbi:hypothetical protein GCM10023082_14740 [Streptomyces tremellae]|uniref:Rieske domain-containing protein n=1 Tax=Streptomyces tremellae TaxID=1124239 RepID=A0ABP7EER7_9ACTN